MDRVCLGLVAVSALSVFAVLPAQAEAHEGFPALTQPVLEVQGEEEPSLVTSQSSLVEDQSQVTTDQGQVTNDQAQITTDQRQVTNDSIPQLSEIEQPTTTIADWMAQIEASLVQITGVRVETTETGLQVILETLEGCHMIQHRMGETCVPNHPKRVVTLSTENLSNALVLGIKPVGSATPFDTTENFPSYLQGKTEGIKRLGTEEQPSIEAIALIKPDLIIGLRSHEAIYPLLSNIAPTVLYNWQSDETWRDQFSFVADVLGKQEAAERAWDQYYQRIEELKLALGVGAASPQENRYHNKTFSFIFFYFGRLGSEVKNSFAGSILNDAGLQRPPAQDVVVPYGSIDFSEEV